MLKYLAWKELLIEPIKNPIYLCFIALVWEILCVLWWPSQLFLPILPCPFVVFLLSSSPVITFSHLQSFPINMSPAALKSNCYGDIFCDTCSKHEACWAARRTEGGLSGMAGLASITMPIETAAQSSVLHSQIRPLDKKALQLDPTHYNGGEKIRYVTHNPWQCAPVKYFTFGLWFNSVCC